MLNFTNGQVIFSGGNLSQPVTNTVLLDSLNRVTNLGSNYMAFSVNTVYGLFSGSFRVPGSTRLDAFTGVLLPSQNAGFGFFLGTNQSGQVHFEAAP